MEVSIAVSPLLFRNPSNRGVRKLRALRVSADYSQIEVRKLSYKAPGTENNILNEVNLLLREKRFGLIFGRSGSGKTSLLQILAGLSNPNSGSIHIQKYGIDSTPIKHSKSPLLPQNVGIVFQFPERYFLADTIIEEITFGWPKLNARNSTFIRNKLSSDLEYAIKSVGLNAISLDEDPNSLSGGFKRRLSLAIQLVKKPDLLLLDEPLAGLDWKARAEVVNMLKKLKKELTILVVSHDLKEMAALVDKSWKMEMGGVLKEANLPI